MDVYEDTDDDDLSDISERSREDDNSDPLVNKTGPFTTRDSLDKKTDSSLQASSASAFQPKSTSNLENTKNSLNAELNERRALAGRSSDADKPSLPLATSARVVVPARRLEQSDSDDTTSGADSQPGKPSQTDTFYSPNESADGGDETDDHKSTDSLQRTSNKIPAVSPTKSLTKQGPPATVTKQDDLDDDDESSDETNSTESQKTPEPSGKMALGERCIRSSVIYGFYTNKYLVPLCVCVCGVSFRLLQQQNQHWT